MAKKAKAKKVVKKRGVKPGTKRGRYRKDKAEKEFTITSVVGNIFKVGDKITFDPGPAFTPKILTLCGQLEDAVMNLETRISNSIAKINSLM